MQSLPCIPALLFLSVLLDPLPARAATVRVPSDVPTLQAAIDLASPGDEIRIEAGIHYTHESIRFRGKAVRVCAEDGPQTTAVRLDGVPARGSVFAFEEGEGADSVLEGLTISGGIGTSTGGASYGGGILCTGGASPTLRQLVVTENRATYGGALYCHGSSPRVVDCTFSRNKVNCGGGAYLDGSAPEFVGCEVTGNRGHYASSGIHSKNGSAPRILGCWIVGNATYYGGGLDSFGGAPYVENSVIAGNFAANGGAAYVSGGSEATFLNCTLVGNRATYGGWLSAEGASVHLANCIIWGNDPSAETFYSPGSLIDVDPRFIRGAMFNTTIFVSLGIQGEQVELPNFVLSEPEFHLRSDSPAIDVAVSAAAPATDREGTPRPQGEAPDAGAYEYVGEHVVPLPFLRGDSNADAEFNLSDPIHVLIGLFGSSAIIIPCDKAADSNDDGTLDLSDAVSSLHALFLGTTVLPMPFQACGTDPTPDGLGCVAYDPCVGS